MNEDVKLGSPGKEVPVPGVGVGVTISEGEYEVVTSIEAVATGVKV